MKKVVEICCGSYYDAKQACLGGAERIELNCALQLGGLTPTAATLRLVKEEFPDLKVVAMVRPRGAGFCYSDDDFKVMRAECESMLKSGADGIAFGCLNADAAINRSQSRSMVDIIRSYGKEAVFHRAFDCVSDPYKTMDMLISIGINRVLTSGMKAKAMDGIELLRDLERSFGQQIQILAGSGVNAANAGILMEATGIRQVHSSCKDWLKDETTVANGVSYSMASGEYELCYDTVSEELVRVLINSVMD